MLISTFSVLLAGVLLVPSALAVPTCPSPESSSTVTSTSTTTTRPSPTPSSGSGNSTHCDSNLCTWWHDSAEINTNTRVQPGNVRQSHRYTVQVAIAGTNEYYNSFVYEAIPRNGNGRIYSPWDYPSDKDGYAGIDDGISIEPSVGINMAWSQFEYNQDVDVKIRRRDGVSLGSPSNVIIRPTSIKYTINSSNDGGIVIRVPRDPNSRKFSVEFKDDLYTYRSDGKDYVSSGGDVVGVEPTNALMIFASPFIPSEFIPNLNGRDVKTMKPGPINEGDWGNSPILYFPPGVYWMNSNQQGDAPKYGENHIRLRDRTYWVHFAAGAYVKGAVEWTTKSNFRATGHGVLSGEHYVYQANVATLYQAKKSDQTSLRMWWHHNLGGGQTWHCVGPTINAPPFNTMDFYGNSDITTRIWDYNQVGAFYFQTDGPQMYPGSIVHDVFYHVGDDAIKTYYSDVKVSRITVWKNHNDPIIQMGWDIRQVSGVEIDHLYVIHTRFRRSETYVPSSIIGASPRYDEGKLIDPSKFISMTVSDIVCEGLCPSLFRITPLQSYRNFNVRNVAFPDGLQRNSIGTGQSIIPAAPGVRMELNVENWTVKGEKVTMNNFQADALGQLAIDVSYWGQWRIS